MGIMVVGVRCTQCLLAHETSDESRVRYEYVLLNSEASRRPFRLSATAHGEVGIQHVTVSRAVGLEVS